MKQTINQLEKQLAVLRKALDEEKKYINQVLLQIAIDNLIACIEAVNKLSHR